MASKPSASLEEVISFRRKAKRDAVAYLSVEKRKKGEVLRKADTEDTEIKANTLSMRSAMAVERMWWSRW